MESGVTHGSSMDLAMAYLIETYNTKVDFVDYDSLKQIVEVIQ